jgi:hypothetical protein
MVETELFRKLTFQCKINQADCERAIEVAKDHQQAQSVR